MYALFVEDTFEPLGVLASKTQAFIAARLLSRERGQSVLRIFNRQNGSTALCGRFENGGQTFDGGCCPAEWATAALNVMIPAGNA